MRKEFVEEMNVLLNTQKQDLISALSASNESFRELAENANTGGDIIDEASDVIDRKMLETLSANDGARLSQIDSALTRIRQGKYGLCIKCGQEIPEPRLRAIPHALLCVNCKSLDERQNR